MAIRYTGSDLRDRATIYRAYRTTNADMEEIEALSEVTTARGMFIPMTGRETMRAEQIEAEPRAMFVLRYRDWMTTNHVIGLRGELYEIHSVVDVEARRQYQELVLTKRRLQPA